MSEEAPFLVCLPYERGLDHPNVVVEGSIKGWCWLCAAEVWISPTGQALIEELGARPHCYTCALGVMDTTADVRIQPPTPAQREELRHHIHQQQEKQ